MRRHSGSCSSVVAPTTSSFDARCLIVWEVLGVSKDLDLFVKRLRVITGGETRAAGVRLQPNSSRETLGPSDTPRMDLGEWKRFAWFEPSERGAKELTEKTPLVSSGETGTRKRREEAHVGRTYEDV